MACCVFDRNKEISDYGEFEKVFLALHLTKIFLHNFFIVNNISIIQKKTFSGSFKTHTMTINVTWHCSTYLFTGKLKTTGDKIIYVFIPFPVATKRFVFFAEVLIISFATILISLCYSVPL